MQTKNKALASVSIPAFLALLGIIIICFFLLIPKVSSRFLSVERTISWNNFLNNTIISKHLDPQKYWEFREFYSPGYFNFSRDGLELGLVEQTISSINIPFNRQVIERSVLRFTSPYFLSLDSLTYTNSLNQIIGANFIQTKHILFENKQAIFYQEGKKIKIIFLLSESEMEKANGFFNYNDTDKKIVANKYWLNVSSFVLP